MSALHIEISCNTRGHKGAGITKDIVRLRQKLLVDLFPQKNLLKYFRYVLRSMIYNYI